MHDVCTERHLAAPRRRSPPAILDDNNWMSNHTTWLSCVTAFEESRALDRANGEDQSSRTTSQSSRRACFDGSELDLQSDGEDDAILFDFVVASSAWLQRSKNSDCEDGPNLLSRRDRYCSDGFQSFPGDDVDILRCSGNTDEGIKRDAAWSHHYGGGVFSRTRSPSSVYRFINGEDIDEDTDDEAESENIKTRCKHIAGKTTLLQQPTRTSAASGCLPAQPPY